MNTPPLLMGAVLVFWGWQTGLLAIGLLLAVILEGSRAFTRRWQITAREFNRVADLSALIFIVMMVYRYFASTDPATRWLPIAFFPLVAAQAYSTVGGITLGALFYTKRRQAAKTSKVEKTYDVSYPYFALTLLAASAANVRTAWFYIGLVFFCGWALWRRRSTGASPVVWLLLLLMAGGAGFIGHIGLHQLHLWVEGKAVDWFIDTSDRDPYRNTTAIGDIGPLKQSDRIVFRTGALPDKMDSLLLKEASYNFYRAGNWFASRPRFNRVIRVKGTNSWIFKKANGLTNTVTIYAPLKNEQGLLKLPLGAYRVEDLAVETLRRNQYGAVKMSRGPGLAIYNVFFRSGSPVDDPPLEQDLVVPDDEKETVVRIKEELKLDAYAPAEAARVVKSFFQNNYLYSLELTSGGEKKTPLSHFLSVSKSGHCEYFASATTLLLRSAGIPARYATGYLVCEFSRLEDKYVVRSRHAHAWTIAYFNGSWHEVDSTPSAWVEFEQSRASLFEPVLDFLSWPFFKLSQWKWGGKKSESLYYLWLLVLPLIFIIARRVFSKKTVAVKVKKSQVGAAEEREIEAGFNKVEKRLTELGFPRRPWEPLTAYVNRIEEAGSLQVSFEELREILGLHYRLRFDPKKLSDVEMEKLEGGVNVWLDKHKDATV